MKYFLRLIFLNLLCVGCFKTQAQQKHFIYIESADKQAFAVVLNGKVYSSSDYGYVIVPKLTDGTYNFTVSFPMNKFPDQNFKCIINKKDVGYKLQNNAGNGWALQNMLTQKVVAGNSGATDNAFSNMLSDVVNDSDLTKKNLPANNKINTDTVAASKNIDTNLTAMQTQVSDSLNSTSLNNSTAQLQKISETKLDTGTNMVFVDKTSGADTIKVFVPSANLASNNNSVKLTVDNNVNHQQTDTATTTLSQSSSSITDTAAHDVSNPFYKSGDQNSNSNITKQGNASSTDITANVTAPPTADAIRNDCSSMLSDNDVDKIKRKMFVQNNADDMVQTALRYVTKKCITTDQVKILGNIFSSDDGRYNLYDALYKYVYDYGKYTSLESQIIDPYYKKRFEAMLR